MYRNIIMIFIVTVLIFCSVFIYSGISFKERKTEEKEIIGRFEVIEKFYVFDNKIDGNHGKILKDRKTGDCYLNIWQGAGNGGPALARYECD